jgi:hypothetical protein
MRSVWFKTLVTLLAVSLVGILLDRLLVRDGFNRADLVIASNVITGLFASLLVYRVSSRQQQQQESEQARLVMVMEANHHIRNALQSISLMAQMNADEKQMEMIRESIRRVDWVLREVIPKLPANQSPPE